MNGESIIEQVSIEQVASIIESVQSGDLNNDPDVVALRSQFVAGEARYADMPERGPRHPQLLALRGLAKVKSVR